jgi:EAL domain-containing protein (putative c-di-GMP-specific phosphodiesterase class I)
MLEITENIVMADPRRILDVVGRLRLLGVGLSLDDFGAGASSLGYIRRLSVDELKIDRSFVMTMDEDEDNATIVRATIELAHNLGLSVVAEGVETRACWRQLKALRCDEIQGYLLSPPVSAERFAGLLTRAVDPPGAHEPASLREAV